MKITITKKEGRNLLRCVRDDGTSMTAELGPGLPHHDLAHYVIERKLRLTGGFFGKLADGYTVAQLSDKDIIKTLGAQTLIAEVVARALQSLSSGACTSDQFLELINTELVQWRIAALAIEPRTVSEMSTEFQSLVERYSALKNGQSIELQFADPITVRVAVAADQKALEALQWRASLSNPGDRDALLSNPEAIEMPLKQIEAGGVFVAEASGSIKGFAAILPRQDGNSELDALFVEPEIWRQGIGRILVDHCCLAASILGASAIHVVGNPHAEGFYGACGFRTLGTEQTRFGVGLLMKRDLL